MADEQTPDEQIRPEYKAALARVNAQLKTMSERANQPYAFIPMEAASADQLILNQFRHIASVLESINTAPASPAFPPTAPDLALLRPKSDKKDV